MNNRFAPFMNSVFCAMLLLMTSQVYAQKNKDSIVENRCVQLLREAEKVYEAGRINQVEGMILPCIESDGFNKFEKLQAYRLIILSKLFDEQPEEAERYLLLLLKTDPEYQVNPVTDPSELIDLYNSYKTIPVYSLGIKAGLNITKPNSYVPYGVYDTGDNTGSYTGFLNVQFGFNADFYLTKKFSLGTDLLLSFKKYDYKNTLLNYSELTFTENQIWLDLPVVLKYTMGQQKLRYYLQAGAGVSMILGSTANIVRKDAATQSNQAIGSDVNTKNMRNPFSYSLIGGGGIRYKTGYGYVVLDVKYLYGLNNLSNGNKKYSDSDLVYKYGYIDNNFTLNTLMFSVGYYKSIYKSKKILPHEK